jgi:hypothetical protein
MNTLTTTPLSNTSSSQSDRIFRKSVFDKAEGDLLDAAAVDGPEIAVGAASDHAVVQACWAVAAVTAGKDDCGDFLVAGSAGGTEWEEDEVVEEDQSIEEENQLTDGSLADLGTSCIKHPVGLRELLVCSCYVVSPGACELRYVGTDGSLCTF